jgi:hypothetical protein
MRQCVVDCRGRQERRHDSVSWPNYSRVMTKYWVPMFSLSAPLLVSGCTATTEDSAEPLAIPWDRGLPALSQQDAPDGFQWARSIVHLHSPWSHDA